jgi:hypothetical protein
MTSNKELDILSKDGRKVDNTVDARPDIGTPDEIQIRHRRKAELQELTMVRMRQTLWYWVAIKLHNMWTGQNRDNSRMFVDTTLVPLYLHYETASLMPDRSTMIELVAGRHRTPSATPNSTEDSEYRFQLLQKVLPLALACSCLTVFIMPLYEGPTVHVMRWIMTLLSAFIGPRLSCGFYPPLGVLIFGLMVNKPLTICTAALGGWACFFLFVVVTKALGLRGH